MRANFLRNDAIDDDHLIVSPEPIIVPQRQFIKTKRGEIFTRYSNKHYRAVYNKGRIVEDLNVKPYGFK